ncbi:MAG: hypothetical protein M1816_001832 [Peltula sp. TS41687]|nr:MAG: hypothetical protein M1816_001832 [Peltula sp. TS41687]
MKDPLKKCIVAITGNQPEPRNPKTLERWVVLNGGKFSSTITKDVTHLICTWDDWKNKAPKVKHALDLGTVDIVTYDWLEDSIMDKKLKRETPYLLMTVEKGRRKREKKEKKKIIAAKERFSDGCAQANQELLLTDLYHIYRDETLFEYNVNLVRTDLSTNRNERYNLKMYESHPVPHMYATTVKFTRVGGGGSRTLMPPPAYFGDAYREFRRFFKKKTGFEWDERLDPRKNKIVRSGEGSGAGSIPGGFPGRDSLFAEPIRGYGGVLSGGIDNPEEDRQFVYIPPRMGQPSGLLPPNWVEDEQPQQQQQGQRRSG